jgi:protein arginine kinase
VKLDALARGCGEWLRGTGPDSDIVVSSRIRLARNLAEFPFIRRCSEAQRRAIARLVRERVSEVDEWSGTEYVDIQGLGDIDRQLLVERQLISRELSKADGPRAVVVEPQETFSLMVNEEDHLRLQVMHSGFDLEPAWRQINQLDDLLEERLPFAFHEQLGYLTACPTNVGTGLRVSVMFHLPGLVLSREIDKVFRSLQKMHLAVRGLYGEGSQALGDFYQISNQLTLGKTEEQLIAQVAEIVPQLLEYERKARQTLLEHSHKDLHDRVSRALGILRTAKTISSEETLLLLSSVRLGINLKLITDIDIATVNRLFLQTQPAHLQKIRGRELDTAERNEERALFLQKHLPAG